MKKLFPAESPLGKMIKIGGRTYTVIGTFAEKGTNFGQTQDDFVMTPITRFLSDYGASRFSVNLATQAPKVNVNLPLGLVTAGLRIGQRYAPELHGIDWDELLDEIQRGANGKLVEVEDEEDNERVEIFVD